MYNKREDNFTPEDLVISTNYAAKITKEGEPCNKSRFERLTTSVEHVLSHCESLTTFVHLPRHKDFHKDSYLSGSGIELKKWTDEVFCRNMGFVICCWQNFNLDRLSGHVCVN